MEFVRLQLLWVVGTSFQLNGKKKNAFFVVDCTSVNGSRCVFPTLIDGYRYDFCTYNMFTKYTLTGNEDLIQTFCACNQCDYFGKTAKVFGNFFGGCI